MSEQKFESWAIVELFGHQRLAGKVTEVSLAGCAFLRVDVPAQSAYEPRDAYGIGPRPAIPEYTRYFGSGAIYALNPCTEKVARRAAEMFRASPPIPFDVPDIAQQSLLPAPEEPD